jgi:hypothetical protein
MARLFMETRVLDFGGRMKKPKKLAGAPRTLSDAEVRLLREWKTFARLCREIGISTNHGRRIRKGYQHKQPSPRRIRSDDK